MLLPASDTRRLLSSWCFLAFLGVGLPGVSTCILLLNGWEPLSLRELAVLADVVVGARTLATYKEERTLEARTYTATFRIFSVLKGGGLLNDIEREPGSRRNVYNVSNFGDKTMCYADVAEGETYLLFLTLFGGRLSAKYDDLFGAAAHYDDESEAEILAAIGWKSWSAWGSCSRTCNGGRQTRRRQCTHVKPKTCEGKTRQHRKCNIFRCKGVKDMLGILTKDLLTPVIKTRKHRRSAILLDQKSNINTATSRVFPRVFPRDFSILVTARARENSDGYVFTVSDLMGFVKLGVRVGSEAGFEYCDQTGPQSSDVVTFPTNLADGGWHQFAYSVQGENVTLYADCIHQMSKPLERRYHATINVNTVISLGRSFIESKRYPMFEGEIEQLLIIPDAQAASQQCRPHSSVRLARKKTKKGAVRKKSDDMPSTDSDEAVSRSPEVSAGGAVIWSAWSPCSVTCGQGVQARTAYCPTDKGIEWKECPKLRHSQPNSRPCSSGECPVTCNNTCYNGGECLTPARCKCPKGYHGRQCELVSCNPACYNGGHCEEPDTCTCLPGYSGRRCEVAICVPACQHGGRCIRPGICACPYGFLPPDCKPICSTPCYNGGTCAGFNYCGCLPGYAGNLCQTAVCERGCGNGGVCIAPNTCLCAAGYAGKRCRKPICVPSCQNGGTCLYPFFCLCPTGTFGSLCEKFMCITRCEHGGTCIGLDTCACPSGFTGKRCEQAICLFGCDNGGKCVSPNVCRCKTGYYGSQCERKKCRFSTRPQSYLVSHRVTYTTTTTTPCGLWGWRTCTKHKTMYKIVYRKHFRHTCL